MCKGLLEVCSARLETDGLGVGDVRSRTVPLKDPDRLGVFAGRMILHKGDQEVRKARRCRDVQKSDVCSDDGERRGCAPNGKLRQRLGAYSLEKQTQ